MTGQLVAGVRSRPSGCPRHYQRYLHKSVRMIIPAEREGAGVVHN